MYIHLLNNLCQIILIHHKIVSKAPQVDHILAFQCQAPDKLTAYENGIVCRVWPSQRNSFFLRKSSCLPVKSRCLPAEPFMKPLTENLVLKNVWYVREFKLSLIFDICFSSGSKRTSAAAAAISRWIAWYWDLFIELIELDLF